MSPSRWWGSTTTEPRPRRAYTFASAARDTVRAIAAALRLGDCRREKRWDVMDEGHWAVSRKGVAPKLTTTQRQQQAEELADAIWQEISDDPRLRTCDSYSELHDFTDANMLGGKVLDRLLAEYSEDFDQMVDIANWAQSIVERRIRDRNAEQSPAKDSEGGR